MESLDVVIVGAGLSGIGAACHLEDHCPGKTYTLLEGRDAIGGTWDLFRYPGIRSDSDMHTLGFSFKPWKERKSIADGTSIREYVNEHGELDSASVRWASRATRVKIIGFALSMLLLVIPLMWEYLAWPSRLFN